MGFSFFAKAVPNRARSSPSVPPSLPPSLPPSIFWYTAGKREAAETCGQKSSPCARAWKVLNASVTGEGREAKTLMEREGKRKAGREKGMRLTERRGSSLWEAFARPPSLCCHPLPQPSLPP
jgi:hypothetical protein